MLPIGIPRLALISAYGTGRIFDQQGDELPTAGWQVRERLA